MKNSFYVSTIRGKKKKQKEKQKTDQEVGTGREDRHIRCVWSEKVLLKRHKLKGYLVIKNFSWLLMICWYINWIYIGLKFIIHEGRESVLLIIVLLRPRIVSTTQQALNACFFLNDKILPEYKLHTWITDHQNKLPILYRGNSASRCEWGANLVTLIQVSAIWCWLLNGSDHLESALLVCVPLMPTPPLLLGGDLIPTML